MAAVHDPLVARAMASRGPVRVQPTRGHVRRHQHFDLVLAEAGDHPFAGILGQAGGPPPAIDEHGDEIRTHLMKEMTPDG